MKCAPLLTAFIYFYGKGTARVCNYRQTFKSSAKKLWHLIILSECSNAANPVAQAIPGFRLEVARQNWTRSWESNPIKCH